MVKQAASLESTAAPLDQRTAERLRSDLLRMLRRRTGDPVLAEDLVQETLMHVVRGLPEVRNARALRTWAWKIALNVWRDHLRHRATAAAGPPAGLESHEFSVSAVLDSLGPGPPAPAPEDALDRHATHDCLLEATRQLRRGEREIILLHDFGDMPLKEVALALSCSPGTAKVRLHRARRHLAEICRRGCIRETATDGGTLCAPKDVSAPENRQGPATKRKRERRR